MVSTRHHPRPFPEPTLAPSRSPQTPTSGTSSVKANADSPPPTSSGSPVKRGSRSTRKSTSKFLDDDNEKDELALAPPPTKPKTRSSRSRSKVGSSKTYTHTPPPALLIWLLFSLPLVVWDSSYLLLRPHTMPGGALHHYLWRPYALYGVIDYLYGVPGWEMKNGFVTAQATLNVLETSMYLWYLVVMGRRVATGDGFVRGIVTKLNIFARKAEAGSASTERSKIVVHGPGVALAVVICFASAVMTVSKTIVYGLNEAFSGYAHTGHNDWKNLIFLWIVPNGLWIVVPTYMCWVLGLELLEGLEGREKAE